ncbi:uncharacterized protein B0T15DRAFT_515476 [Chaetomium strumarium]|uniref:GST N-terminal domain-containing protein n=1 Tax=Chaetomium strumarium TaxID=1170767 RepID=A0AAJ0H0C7_9PEZI|nr:hypothetical protein B0T15DRAFT_515476 [Chaetomium strumarium]
MASEQIVFFDLRSKEPNSCWSLNPWKTRLLLNYKGLDYRTEWLEYPELKGRFEKHVPAQEGSMPYTIPTILLPSSGEYVMDSKKIAQRLESLHPSPPLHLDAPVLAKLEEILSQRFFPPLRPILLDRVPKRILSDASIPYWVRTRSAMVGKPLDEFCAEHTHEECFAKAEPAIREVTALLVENEAGPFFLGEEVSYVDFVWAGNLYFWQRNGEDVFEELLRRSGNAEAHRKLLEGVAPWAKRDAE